MMAGVAISTRALCGSCPRASSGIRSTTFGQYWAFWNIIGACDDAIPIPSMIGLLVASLARIRPEAKSDAADSLTASGTVDSLESWRCIMPSKVKPIPEGHHALTPYRGVHGAGAAIDVYEHACGAKELFRRAQRDGRVGHAEVQIGDSRLMLADEFPDMGFRSPHAVGGTPVHLHLYVEN